MQSRLDMIEELGIRRSFAFACVSFAFYGSAMLAIALFAQPLEAPSAVKPLEASAPEVARSAKQAKGAIGQDAPARAALSVSRPESFQPLSGEVSILNQPL